MTSMCRNVCSLQHFSTVYVFFQANREGLQFIFRVVRGWRQSQAPSWPGKKERDYVFATKFLFQHHIIWWLFLVFFALEILLPKYILTKTNRESQTKTVWRSLQKQEKLFQFYVLLYVLSPSCPPRVDILEIVQYGKITPRFNTFCKSLIRLTMLSYKCTSFDIRTGNTHVHVFLFSTLPISDLISVAKVFEKLASRR